MVCEDSLAQNQALLWCDISLLYLHVMHQQQGSLFVRAQGRCTDRRLEHISIISHNPMLAFGTQPLHKIHAIVSLQMSHTFTFKYKERILTAFGLNNFCILGCQCSQQIKSLIRLGHYFFLLGGGSLAWFSSALSVFLFLLLFAITLHSEVL